ncbi:MAG: hypothetical protein EOO60_13870 [Hymenobacter sp.]|nr:MAG: hypothetical protein EOO60_13870 [Hymenobacter sp.]
MPDNSNDFPAIETLAITITYGGVLTIIASSLAGQWSGQASLIVFYLVLIAPIVMGIIAYKNRTFRTGLNHRKWVFYAGALYFIITPIAGLLLVLFERYTQKA